MDAKEAKEFNRLAQLMYNLAQSQGGEYAKQYDTIRRVAGNQFGNRTYAGTPQMRNVMANMIAQARNQGINPVSQGSYKVAPYVNPTLYNSQGYNPREAELGRMLQMQYDFAKQQGWNFDDYYNSITNGDNRQVTISQDMVNQMARDIGDIRQAGYIPHQQKGYYGQTPQGYSSFTGFDVLTDTPYQFPFEQGGKYVVPKIEGQEF